MKKVAFTVCMIVCTIIGYVGGFKHFQNDVYSMTAIVSNLDYENDIVTISDFNGRLYCFYGCEDWQIDDIASVVMLKKGTETILDDEIIDVKYSGVYAPIY